MGLSGYELTFGDFMSILREMPDSKIEEYILKPLRLTLHRTESGLQFVDDSQRAVPAEEVHARIHATSDVALGNFSMGQTLAFHVYQYAQSVWR